MLYMAGTDISVNAAVQPVLDVLGQHVFDTPLLVAAREPSSVGTTGLSFPDVGFRTGWIDAVAG